MMKTVVIDVQGYVTPDFEVKELVIFDGNRIKSWLFKPNTLYRNLSKDLKKTVNFIFYQVHGIPYNSGITDYNQVNRILREELTDVGVIFVKGHMKKNFLLNHYLQNGINPPEIINLEFSTINVPKLTQKYISQCNFHKLAACSCSVNNAITLYNYIANK